MTILDTVLNKNSTLQQLFAEAEDCNASIIKVVQAGAKPTCAVIIIRGADTKAYLDALNRIDELLEEDCDVEDKEPEADCPAVDTASTMPEEDDYDSPGWFREW